MSCTLLFSFELWILLNALRLLPSQPCQFNTQDLIIFFAELWQSPSLSLSECGAPIPQIFLFLVCWIHEFSCPVFLSKIPHPGNPVDQHLRRHFHPFLFTIWKIFLHKSCSSWISLQFVIRLRLQNPARSYPKLCCTFCPEKLTRSSGLSFLNPLIHWEFDKHLFTKVVRLCRLQISCSDTFPKFPQNHERKWVSLQVFEESPHPKLTY